MKPWVLVLILIGIATVFIGGFLFAIGGGRMQTSYNKLTGQEIYGKLCLQCHGDRGTAPTGLANSYAGKRQHWDEVSLLAYIANPPKVKRTKPHLARTHRVMPAISRSVPAEARQKLVTYVIGLMDALEPTD